jgi:acyl carrier protein
MMDTIEDKIATYIADNILFSNKGYPHPHDASFLDNGIVDSMNVLELVMFVEEKFGVQVGDGEIVPDNFDSVSRLAAFIRRKAN